MYLGGYRWSIFYFSIVILQVFAGLQNLNVGTGNIIHPDIGPQGSSIMNLKIGVVTWNMAEHSPTIEDCYFLQDYRDCDIIAVGLQECEDIRPRRKEGRRIREWRNLREKIFESGDYDCVRERKMGGLHLSLYIRKNYHSLIKGVKTIEIPCGVGNILTNKGAICFALRLANKKTIAFIDAHLAAHQNMVKVRNANYRRIVQAIQEELPTTWVTRKGIRLQKSSRSTNGRKFKGSNLLDSKGLAEQASKQIQLLTGTQSVSTPVLTCKDIFDAAFYFGDLNYRNDLPMLQIELFCHNYGYPRLEEDQGMGENSSNNIQEEDNSNVKNQKSSKLLFDVPPSSAPAFEKDLAIILKHDQLIREMRRYRAFRGFEEMPIRFPPSFKYDKRSPNFDSKKGRCPAWTDRILFSCPQNKVVDSKQSIASISQSPELPVTNPADSLRPISYECYDVRSSDHRPVGAKFDFTFDTPIHIKSTNLKKKKVSSQRRLKKLLTQKSRRQRESSSK